jgi:hypothetical protein
MACGNTELKCLSTESRAELLWTGKMQFWSQQEWEKILTNWVVERIRGLYLMEMSDWELSKTLFQGGSYVVQYNGSYKTTLKIQITEPIF